MLLFHSCVLCGRFDRVVVIESGGATTVTTVDSVGEMMTNTHSEAESCRTGNWQTAIDLQTLSKSLSWSSDDLASRRYRRTSGQSGSLSERDKRIGCGQLCLMILKFISTSCYVFCPPIPELITRKLAFHPPRRGFTYVIAVHDDNAANNHLEVDSAAKAIRFQFAQIKPRKLSAGNRIPLDDIVTTFVKTRRGSLITTILIKNHNEHPNPRTKDVVVLFSQPNGSDLGCYLQPQGLNLRWLANELDVDVYAYDYSGFGTSTGHASEKNIYYDIEAVYEHILTTRGRQIRIVLIGFSIGTAPSIAHAAQHPPNLCGVVLIAPFTSGWRLLFKREPTAETCFFDRFLSYERAPEIDVPVLICHGSLDATIPISHGKILHTRMKRAVRPLFLTGADHLSIFSNRNLVVFWRIRYFMSHEIDSL
uniref:Abhydrolase domain-containing protein n=1 Tax=Ascaris suum TaxID=6253 RepID=F1L7A9_ASCSU